MDLPGYVAVIVIVLLVIQVVILGQINQALIRLAKNQVSMDQRAHDDVTVTADALGVADSSRQTHNEDSGENTINTTIK